MKKWFKQITGYRGGSPDNSEEQPEGSPRSVGSSSGRDNSTQSSGSSGSGARSPQLPIGEKRRSAGSVAAASAFAPISSGAGLYGIGRAIGHGDITPQLISSAGQTLAEAIEEILSDISTLKGNNISGFEQLVTILESTDTEIAESDHGKVNGEGCIEILLLHSHHPRFIQTCRQNKLTTALINAMRMLRMFETKLASRSKAESSLPSAAVNENAALSSGPVPSTVLFALESSSAKMTELSLSDTPVHEPKEQSEVKASPTATAPRSATGLASERACTLLRALLADAEILQQLKADIIIKLLTYPLTALPLQGVHLQRAVAMVVSSLCKHSLPAHVVFVLQENHAVTHMIAYLKELTEMPSSHRLHSETPTSSSLTVSLAQCDPTQPTSNPTSPTLPSQSPTLSSPSNNSEVGNSAHNPFADIPTIGRTISEISEDLESEASTPSNSPHRASRTQSASRPLSVLTQAQEQIQMQLQAEGDVSRIMKGKDAERLGMWPVGLSCISDLITASVSFGPALMYEFEAAGGHKLLVHILSHSSPPNVMAAMLAAMRLLSDPHKGPEEPIAFPKIAAAVAEVLVSTLRLNNSISPEDDIDALINVSSYVGGGEYMSLDSFACSFVQNIAYSLLTLYSNQPQNCQILESAYSFLPILLLAVPAIRVQEAVLAVLTNLHYVCQCIEDSSQLPLSALCASTYVVVMKALSFTLPRADRAAAVELLDALISSIDCIIRARAKYTMQIIRFGLLHKVICIPFERLNASVQDALPIESLSMPVYSRLLALIVNISRQCPYLPDEIRKSGLHVNVRNLIKSPLVSPEFTSQLLQLSEVLAMSDTSHLSESIQTIIDVLRQTQGDFCKTNVIFIALSRILCGSQEAPRVWRTFGGTLEIMKSLSTLEGIFLVNYTPPQSSALYKKYHSAKERQDDAFRCLKSAMLCLSLDFSLHEGDGDHRENGQLPSQFRTNYVLLAEKLTSAGLWHPESLFASDCLAAVFGLIGGYVSASYIVNADAAQILIESFPAMSDELRLRAVQMLDDCACARLDGRQLLVESGFVRLLIEKFAAALQHPSSEFEKSLLNLVTRLMMDYLSLSDFAAALKYVVRPDVVTVKGSLSAGASSAGVVLPAWASPTIGPEPAVWTSLSLLHSIAQRAISTHATSVPYVSLGLLGATDPATGPAYLSLTMSETSRPFPTSCFTLSCWIQVPPPPSSQSLQRFRCDSDTFQEATVATIFVLSSPVMRGCFFEALYDVQTSSVTIYIKRESSGKVTVLRFTAPNDHSLSKNEWNFVTVTLRRPRRFNISMKTTATANIGVYINGMSCSLANRDSWNASSLEYDLSPAVTGQHVEIAMGKSYITTAMQDTDKSRPIPSTFAPYIRLGPVLLFDEALERAQISWLYLKGYSYSGIFHAGDPSKDSSASDRPSLPLSEILFKCQAAGQSVQAFCETLGFKDIDAIGLVTPLPAAVVALSAHNSFVTQKSHLNGAKPVDSNHARASTMADNLSSHFLSAPLTIMELSLFNAMESLSTENSVHVASIQQGWHKSTLESMGSCLASIGGPSVLFPLVHAASTEAQLVESLMLIRVCAHRCPSNENYLGSVGYNVLAFLLSKKTREILTPLVLESIFDLCLSCLLKGALRVEGDAEGNVYNADQLPAAVSNEEIPSSPISPPTASIATRVNFLLASSAALKSLVLNHQVWKIHRWSYAMKVIEFLVSLVHDPLHAAYNSKVLSSQGIVQWVLMMCVYGADRDEAKNSAILTYDSESIPSTPVAARLTIDRLKDASALNPAPSPQGARCGQSAADAQSEWTIRKFEDLVVADGFHDDEPFFTLAMKMAKSVISKDVQIQDLSVIANIILYTFVPRYVGGETSIGSDTPPTQGSRGRTRSSTSCRRRHSSSFSADDVSTGGKSSGEKKILVMPPPPSPLKCYLLPAAPPVISGTSNTLSSFALLRVYLLRLVFSVYEHSSDPSRFRSSTTETTNKPPAASEILALFRKVFHADWFLCILEKVTDVATKSSCLRLLAIFIQKDPIFQKGFCEKEGMKMLRLFLTFEPASLPVLLPLLSLLFRIPAQILPFQYQIKTVENLTRLLDLSNVRGPDLSEPVMSECTLPTLSIVLECLTCRANERRDEMPSWVSQVIVGMIMCGFEKLPNFRALMQHRRAVEMVSSATLACSNAVDEFGPHIFTFSDSDEEQDLTMAIKEHYIPSGTENHSLDEAGINRSLDTHRVIADDGDLPYQARHVFLLGYEGLKMAEIIFCCIKHGISEFHNQAAISHFALSFPAHLVGSFACGFQSMIFSIARNVCLSLCDGALKVDVYHDISHCLTQLVPLSRARLLDDTVQLDILHLSLVILEIAKNPRSTAGSAIANADALQGLCKDLGATCRFFAVACLYAVSAGKHPKSLHMRRRVLIAIRSNLSLLLLGSLEDSTDTSPSQPRFALKRDSAHTEEKSVGVAVLEAFQISWGPSNDPPGTAKKSIADTHALSLAQQMKTRVSATLCMSLSTGCFSLLFDDDHETILEAVRIYTLLSLRRRSVMEALLSNSKSALQHLKHALGPGGSTGGLEEDTEDFFRNGILGSLVPEGSAAVQYEEYLTTLAASGDGSKSQMSSQSAEAALENTRMKLFVNWLSCHQNLRLKSLACIDAHLLSLAPSPADVVDIIKQMQATRTARPELSYDGRVRVGSLMQRAEAGLQQADQVVSDVQDWNVRGFAQFSCGALAWRRAWAVLQAGPVWGQHPGGMSRGWKLDNTEGPERTRRRLEQDHGPGIASFIKPARKIVDLTAAAAVSGASRSSSSADAATSEIVESSRSSTPTVQNASDPSPKQSQTSACKEALPKLASASEDMEEFLLQVTRRGLLESIRRVNAAPSDDGDEHAPIAIHADSELDARIASPPAVENADDDVCEKGASPCMTDAASLPVPSINDAVPTVPAENEAPLVVPFSSIARMDSEEALDASALFDARREHTQSIDSVSLEIDLSRALARRDDASLVGKMGSEVIAQEQATVASDTTLGTDGASASRVSALLALGTSSAADQPTQIISPSFSLSSIVSWLDVGGSKTSPEGRLSAADNSASLTGMDAQTTRTSPATTSPNIPLQSNIGARSTSPFSLAWDSGSRKLKAKPKKFANAIDEHRALILAGIVSGMVGEIDWKEGLVYNVQRISALETTPALLVLTQRHLHLVCGFQVLHSTSKGHPATLQNNTVSWLQPGIANKSDESSRNKPSDSDSTTSGRPPLPLNNTGTSISGASVFFETEDVWLEHIWTELLSCDVPYRRIPLDTIYSVFRRKHHLKLTALEISDIAGFCFLFSAPSTQDSDDLLARLLEHDLPLSIFHRVLGAKSLQLMARGVSNMYNRLMATFVSSVQHMWLAGQLSNFEYLIHINAAAGRSFQDLTQYPIFPWVLADYTSETLDLSNPATFRDLTRPMGAIGDRRARQFADRYATMDEFRRDGVEGSPPPFFYGTHYSCAGYVLHYLLRLQPYGNLAVTLQGGHFDKADRLFTSIDQSWRSASQENLQDVRELIPEFYYLPEFLINSNEFEFGTTQKGDAVSHVTLPPWAKNDPMEFIRLHRQALESRHVSENLHHWVDLIFGYKQRGEAAEEAKNVFIHLTYDGEVDVDAINDPVLRNATISQINNFGMTPSKLFSKPHKKRSVPEVFEYKKSAAEGLQNSHPLHSAKLNFDPYTLSWHEHVSPPLCVVGAPSLIRLHRISLAQLTSSSSAHKGPACGDAQIVSRDKVVAVPKNCILLPPTYRNVLKAAELIRGVVVLVGQNASRMTAGENGNESKNDVSSVHESMHSAPISVMCVTKSGDVLATGCDNGSISLWSLAGLISGSGFVREVKKIEKLHSFAGHSAAVSALALCPELNLLLSGCADGSAGVWDVHTSRMLRMLPSIGTPPESILAVSISMLSGYLVTLSPSHLRVFSINGQLIAHEHLISSSAVPLSPARSLVTPACGEWQDGPLAITGHEGGQVHLWKLKSGHGGIMVGSEQAPLRSLCMAHTLPRTHNRPITLLRLVNADGRTTSSKREMVTRSFDELSTLELLVGDSDGMVSRWGNTRLDALSPDDVQALISEHSALNFASSLALASRPRDSDIDCDEE